MIKPIVTEKSIKARQLGKYFFEVGAGMGKLAIKDLVSSQFGVKVIDVNVQNSKPYKKAIAKSRRKIVISGIKTAIVTLATGSKIDILEMNK